VALVSLTTSAAAAGLDPGEYSIGVDGISAIERICLVGDGTWYGVNFNFGGNWQNDPNFHDHAAIHGNYAVQGHDYDGYGNTTMTVVTFARYPKVSVWYDWFDDNSYAFAFELPMMFAKKDCDAPFTGENTHAASQPD
jgi:hypothetical protein